MKFLIVGDLHGAIAKIHYKEFNAIIAPGDFCDMNEIRPFIFESIAAGQAGIDVEWYELVGKREARKMINRSVKQGRAVLKHLNGQGVPVYLVPGNVDKTGHKNADWALEREDHFAKMKRGLKNVHDLHFTRRMIRERDGVFAGRQKKGTPPGYDMVGYGICSGPEYPQTKAGIAKYEDDELAAQQRYYDKRFNKLDRLFKDTKRPTIFLSHNMPYRIMDKVLLKSSPVYGRHYGSVVTRDIIAKHKPLVMIGGHMHEYFGKRRFQKTTVINAGFGPNVNTLLELRRGNIRKIECKRGK